jgi:hypothetical protein
MTKPSGDKGQGKCGGCARKVHALIRGGLSGKRPGAVMGAGLRPGWKHLESPPDPKPAIVAARRRVTAGVIGQKSADGIVADGVGNDAAAKAGTR